METKKADMDYISEEIKEFLEEKFVLNRQQYGGIATAKSNTSVRLLYSPDWTSWMHAAFYTAFATWNNGVEVCLDNIPLEKIEQLTLRLLKKRPIAAVLESAVFVIAIDNIPRSMTHQIVRHRGMSFSQESYRVTPAHHADVRIPANLSAEQRAKIAGTANNLRSLYLELVDSGVPIEQARNILPMGTCTHIIMTTSLKALQDYLRARTLDIAQDEHTFIATLICKEIGQKAPEFYDNFIKTEKIESIIKQYEN